MVDSNEKERLAILIRLGKKPDENSITLLEIVVAQNTAIMTLLKQVYGDDLKEIDES